MGAKSRPQARSTLKLSLRTILDPEPSKRDLSRVWAYFNSECGYCGRKLDRTKREGHLDHLIPSSQGGINHVSNRVLSCADCNGNEKKDLPWEPFLQQKCATAEALEKRRRHIKSWISAFSSADTQLPPDVHAELEEAISRAVAAYDAAVEEVVALRERMK